MREWRRRIEWGIACGVLLGATVSVFGTSPHLVSVSPAGGQRGTEVQLVFRGDRLQDTEEVIYYEPGLEARRLDLVTNKVVKATIRISPQCDLGEHHLRLRTASGLSELRTFFVGAFPVVEEKELNNTPAEAQRIALNSTVTGVITSEDADCFAVELTKGERFSAEVEGMRLGRGMFDPRLTLLETNGTVIADVDDTWLGMQDPFLSLAAPNDGTFILQLREATYGGNNDCHYLLHVGNFPRPTSVYPPGGRAGETVAFKFFSEATGEFEQEVKLPATPQERFGLFAEQDGLAAPSPNWIRVSTFPNVLATGVGTNRDQATVAEQAPPLALNGILSRKGREDWFRFPAAAGKPLAVKVYARQLRSPLDSVIDVFDAAGRSLGANDDASGADSALTFTPPVATNYFVRVRDTLGRFGRDFTYRVEVTPAEPEVTVKIPEVSRNDTQSRQYIAVPRGNRFATLISARRANFGGDLRFELAGLPPGVTLQADTLPAAVDAEPLVFEAAPEAAIGGRLLDLKATGTNAAGMVTGSFRQEIELVQGPNNTAYYSTRVDGICVAVTKEAPFKLRVVEPRVPLVQAGSMGLEIVAERAAGFEGPIEVRMVWNPPGVSSQSEATIPKGGTNVFYQLNAGGGAETRQWKVAMIGHATVDGGEVFVSTQLAPLEVTTPYVSGKIETLAASPGRPATLRVSLQQLKPFEGKAKARLLGLPEKVTAPEKEISKDDHQVAFDLMVDPACRPGSFRNLFCAVEVPDNGQVIAHTIASGGILRVLPAVKEGTRMASAERKK